MNFSIIRYILFCVLEFIGVFMSLPCLVAVFYKEKSGFAFLAVMLFALLIGEVGRRFKPKSKVFYAREGFVTVSLSWLMLSVVGALPFLLSGEIPSFTDALYETIAGITTTGNSILLDVEVLSKCIQFWRLFTHWIGGMGGLVLILAVMPLSGSYNMHLMRAESPGPSVGKLVPKIRHTAIILYGIYVAMTAVQVIALLIAGLPLFDSLTMSFSTMGTGGFGIVNTSAASYSAAVQIILLVFMLLCGINFNVFYLFLIKKPKDVLMNSEMRWYLIFILLSSGCFLINILPLFDSLGEAVRHALFQSVSIITTTGLTTTDYMQWPVLAQTVIFLLSICGACAGSTGGGFKVSRVIILFRTVQNELLHVIHPKSVRKVQYDGRNLGGEVTKSVQVYLVIYVMVFLGSALLISVDGFDFATNMSAVAACLNNIGPGLNAVGPTGNFSIFSVFSKYVLMFDMLVGRLELIPLLILLTPRTWKK